MQLELLKFTFMIDLLPPSRHYTSVSVHITRKLSGLFDTEALITRRVLAKLIERPQPLSTPPGHSPLT